MGLKYSQNVSLFLQRVIIGIFTLFVTTVANASSLVDHVSMSKEGRQEKILISFNQPVFYLYHTPGKSTNSTLIGLKTVKSTSSSGNSYHQALTTAHSEYISDMEIFSEAGFNTHMYLQFRTPVNITIKQGSDLRSIIIILKPGI